MEEGVYKLLYDLEIYGVDKRKLRVLGEDFVRKNKNKCKLIMNNKKTLLKDVFNFNLRRIKERIIKLKLLLDKNIFDMSYMFNGCFSLIKISLVSDAESNTPNGNPENEPDENKEPIEKTEPNEPEFHDTEEDSSSLYKILYKDEE